MSTCFAQAPSTVVLRVTDEHSNSISQARAVIRGTGFSETRSSDAAGRATFSGLPGGASSLTVEKSGFYSQTRELNIGAGRTEIEVQLAPVREYTEKVEVTGRSSPVDPQETAGTDALSAGDVLAIPYPTSRDFRNVLPYIPGVIIEAPGQIHIAGASTHESEAYLDGFEVSQPAAGSIQLRVSPDAIRLIEVENTRSSVRFGKASGGVLNLESQDADNRFRWNVANFIPTFQMRRGFHFNSWTPRGYVSGPIIKNKLWYYIAHAGENTLDIVEELPANQDSSYAWRADELVKLQWVPGARHAITTTVVINLADFSHAGISRFDPISTSRAEHSSNYFFGVRDQIKLGQVTLLQIGAAYQRFRNTYVPQGTYPWVFTPSGRTGNFFETSFGRSRRAQQYGDLFLRPLIAGGSHHISLGGRLDQLAYSQTFQRSAILFTNAAGQVERETTFGNTPHFRRTLNEFGAYLQDRWHLGRRFTVEGGIRWDRDTLLDDDTFSPRIAATYLLSTEQETKLSAGWGHYAARTNLDLVTRPMQGVRTDTFFSPGSPVSLSSSTMTFLADPGLLELPQATNWSVGVESRVLGHTYAAAEFITRTVDNAFGFVPSPTGVLELANTRSERYRAAELRLEHQLAESHRLAFAYTRSRAVTNQVLDYSVGNPVYGDQVAGRLPWDAPNQLISWGSFPLRKTIDFVYAVLWRSGFPFVTVDSQDQLVETNRRRLPDYFSFSPAIEKRFSIKSYRLAVRLGVENVTNRPNPVAINNNVESPFFLQYTGTSHRTFNGRLRLLGRK